jgi:hypothetical protein
MFKMVRKYECFNTFAIFASVGATECVHRVPYSTRGRLVSQVSSVTSLPLRRRRNPTLGAPERVLG